MSFDRRPTGPRSAGPDGLLVLDKPAGMTSRTALDRALRWFPSGTRMGHTGTLDPLATGVLVACLGQATRLAEYVQRMGKKYRSTFRLGSRSDTDDADGTVVPVEGAVPPERQAVESLLATFVGPQEQTPPAFSAAKVTGRRAYDLARAGRTVVLTPRRVEIYAVELLSYDYPLLEVDVSCGKGTYIRSLARDLGERLSCGGYVESLRRTAVGPCLVEKAVALDVDAEFARSQVQPAGGAVAELTRAELTAADVERLRRGQGVALPDGLVGEVAVFDAAGRLAVVAAADPERRVLRPEKVFG